MSVHEQGLGNWDAVRPKPEQGGEPSVLMLAGAVHDLNNIISTIGGFAHFLVEDLPDHSASRGFAERISDLSGRASRIAKRLLALARGERAERRVLDLRDGIGCARAALQSVLPSGAQLVLQLPNQPVQAWLSDVELFQILLNLCQNAGDALPHGTGRVTIAVEALDPDTPRPPIAAGSWADARPYGVVRVIDDGVGMEAAVAARCFEAYFTTKAGTGTGLGLSVVQQIALAAGGTLALDSVPQRGTTVSVFLPAAAPPGFPLS